MDNRLKNLYNHIAKDNIHVIFKHFSRVRKGMCSKVGDYEAIVIDKVVTSEREEMLILAEELGHLKSNSLYYIQDLQNPVQKENVMQAEARAGRCKCELLISVEDLIAVINDPFITCDYDAAEALGVDVETYLCAVRTYTQKEQLVFGKN